MKDKEAFSSPKNKKVFVSGCYDMLHSGHVAFFKEAAQYGDLYVGIGSDETIRNLKNRQTIYSEKERLYMVKAIRYVKDAVINRGSGMMDFVASVDEIKPDIFVVNTDGGSEEKRKFCEERGIEYIELQRIPEEGLKARSTTSLRSEVKSQIPYRVDIAGTWIDQPYVSQYGAGWAITASIEPTAEFMERGGMSTSTRNAAKSIWKFQLPEGDEETLARLLFCFENHPEDGKGHISGAQDAIGICLSGLARHYYDNTYWPTKIERIHDPKILDWLENHIALVPMFPRRQGCSVVEGKDITPEKVRALTDAADRTWEAIKDMDLERFVKGYQDSFDAQVAMFPAMMQPGVQDWIDKVKNEGALAWKMTGAGGGGHLLIVHDGSNIPSDAISIKIRRL
ncbi:MAG: adenylyltransferase/cytidyltransferase family protein [Muribaculaceae bacterium]|nr:adenylyltransferase/cytidyltransferase family protein [Muribaculaceae bacterium]